MAKVIAVVGAGGKTTRIHNLTKQYREEGKRVLVTTTTHMYREEGCILSGNVEEIIQRLDTCGYCMAGMPTEEGKMKELSKEVYETICDFAEVVLVEADGSKGYPVKYPAEHEPVIPDNVTEIQVVMGLRSIGHPVGEVCHRKELVMKCLKVTEDTLLTKDHLDTLVMEGYVKPLGKQYPKAYIEIFMNDYKCP